jgi:hypothetical protein
MVLLVLLVAVFMLMVKKFMHFVVVLTTSKKLSLTRSLNVGVVPLAEELLCFVSASHLLSTAFAYCCRLVQPGLSMPPSIGRRVNRPTPEYVFRPKFRLWAAI